ncbi:MAG: hypothetical protein HY781_00630 [Chloroflexi bacterium]|nr:hypothetical protein [Chloroflexota bacterium]
MNTGIQLLIVDNNPALRDPTLAGFEIAGNRTEGDTTGADGLRLSLMPE